MRILIALLVLIAFSTDAQACWPPTNIVDNSTNEVEPVKVVEPIEVVEPVEETPEIIDEGEETDDFSTDKETEVVSPVVDTIDEDLTEETEVVEVPALEVETEIPETEIPRSGGYGEAHVVELNTIEKLIETDAEAHPVETEPVLLASISTNSTAGQNDESNTKAVNTDDNNKSYGLIGITLVMIVLIAIAIYNIRK